jgi:hypothetical protein
MVLIKRSIGVAVAAGALIIGGATAALAVGYGQSYSYTLSTSGAQFVNGYTVFYPDTINHGGMEYRGGVKDTSSDGNSVYVQAKVMGYGWGGRVENFGGNGTTLNMDRYAYDPSATYVTCGDVEVCTNVSFGSDPCGSKHMTR